MRYRVINENISFDSIIKQDKLVETLLRTRGVKGDINKFLNLTQDCVYPSKLFNNIDIGFKCFLWHINNNSHIHVLVDNDQDGYTSSAIIYQYIKDLSPNINITFNFNEGKKHGLIRKYIEDFLENDMLIIIPDSSSNDLKSATDILKDYDLDILVLDHHNIEEDNRVDKNDDRIILINNQELYPNKTLAGAGVAYKFIQYVDEQLKLNYSNKYLDLMALGCIGDAVSLCENYETRYLCLEGIKKINNELIREIIIKNETKIENWEQVDKNKINISYCSWNISPKINGFIRCATLEEKRELFLAMVGEGEKQLFQPRRKKKTDPKPEPIEISFQRYMANKCFSLKSKQDKMVKECYEELTQKIKNENLLQENDKILIIDGTEVLRRTSSSFSGLIANKFLEYNRPVLVLNEKDEKTFGGSGRMGNLPIENFAQELIDSGLCESHGHAKAFGCVLPKQNVNLLREYFNNKFKDVDMQPIDWVDFEIQASRLKNKNIEDVGKLSDLWGNGLDKPQFMIKDLEVPVENITLVGDKANTIKIIYKKGMEEITFIMFRVNRDIYNEMIMKSNGFGKSSPKRVNINAICSFTNNEYNGDLYPQVIIQKYEVKESNIKKRRF
jgi:single-stranded-DNA-specific exonuclease